MHPKLKSLDEQVVVITGASSGIGLTTARMAADRGARLVLAARDEGALRSLAQQLSRGGAEVEYVVADVANEDDVKAIADKAISVFGRIDTWVNNAGVTIYGRLVDVPESDSRRLFDTNFWGVVNGSQVALMHMRSNGGSIINIGSVLSDRAIPLQGMYCATKHAVKGFTDAFRMEVEEEGIPISVTLIKPAAIDTPYPEHGRNYLGVAPRQPGPVYDPTVAAKAILYAAEHPVRDLYAGGGAKAFAASGRVVPRVTDKVMERRMFTAQRTDRPGPTASDSLFVPGRNLRERGGHDGHVMKRSLYTDLATHPLALAFLASIAALGALLAGRRLATRRA
ncbi:MAG: SDR family oxidoreductase [Polyangiaceae bacterium]|nr:SDR family oxidoreductase [Polyangiaceae bacterium]